MQTVINRLKMCGIIQFNLLAYGEVDFIPDERNGTEDHATPNVSTTDGADGAANLEYLDQESVGESTSRFSTFDPRPPPG
jgi:hypothetical protein